MSAQSPSPASGHSREPPQHQIGVAARRSGVSAANIRFYEKEKLIAQRGQGASSYRMYSEADIHQLRFIRSLRGLGMGLAEVRVLLGLDLGRKRDCQVARDALDAHLASVRQRLKELRQLDKQLSALRLRCDGQGSHCHLIEALHQHADAVGASAAAL